MGWSIGGECRCGNLGAAVSVRKRGNEGRVGTSLPIVFEKQGNGSNCVRKEKSIGGR